MFCTHLFYGRTILLTYYLLCVLFSWRTIFLTYYFLVVLFWGNIYCLHVSMLCPHCRYLLFPLSCSGCLAFYFVYLFLPSYQVFFLILLPLLSISFLLAFLLGCTCRKLIDFPLHDRGLSYSLRMRKCHCFLAKLLAERGWFIYPRHPPKSISYICDYTLSFRNENLF